MKDLKRVVVTGLGALTPLGNDVASTWQALVAGKSGAAPITLFDASKFKTQFACEVKNFDASLFLDRKEARKLDRYSQLAIAMTDEAIKDSGLNLDAEDKDQIGVILGVGMGGLRSFEDEVKDYALGDGTPRFSPFFIPKVITNMAAGHVAIRHGLRGPNFITASACASSSHAIASAYDQIRLGRASVILTGGSAADVTASGIGGFNSLHAISQRNDEPEKASRPFSKSRDGFVLGEGGVCLVLEELEHAKARGAKIYAELCGVGMSNDAHHMTAPHPEGEGAVLTMRRAIEEAGILTNQVDYINAHGTSTPLGDVAEIKAIERLFGEHAYQLNISSTKSMTGHLLGAAGAIEAMVCVMAIANDIVPPTINHEPSDDDEAINPRLRLTFNQAEKKKIDYALSNTFGFGGHNATLVFGKLK